MTRDADPVILGLAWKSVARARRRPALPGWFWSVGGRSTTVSVCGSPGADGEPDSPNGNEYCVYDVVATRPRSGSVSVRLSTPSCESTQRASLSSLQSAVASGAAGISGSNPPHWTVFAETVVKASEGGGSPGQFGTTAAARP